MATKEGKGKKVKDADKKSSKKNEDAQEEKKTESFVVDMVETPTIVQAIPDPPIEEPPKDPTPEPIYEEPVLTELIVESYEGEKAKGLYDGDGVCLFKSGSQYRGWFSEGLMHGHGKYIWPDGVEYEGEFCKNEVTGKGAYKWKDGSMYVGDVVKGKRHGDGTFQWPDNKMSYTGKWDQGMRNGKGRMDYDSEGRSFYDGDWVKNIRHGWGVRRYPSGNMYDGMWFNNARHGQGTMKWVDSNQIYTGQWENGIQHGLGQHIWLLHRVPGSQYAMRNMYDGEFVNGLRHGLGSFHYANGASYNGYWKNNMKHGKGKFLFKNGRMYEGQFENDHIVEYPEFTIDGAMTPDISGIRTRTPLPSDNMSVHSNESRNTVSPNFNLEIDALLNELPEADREEETNQVMYVITRNISSLRKVYNFYSQLGYMESLDNTFTMTRMQFWRFAKDCCFHHSVFTLTDMDRFIGKYYKRANFELHNPYEHILQRQFVNYLVLLAYQIYSKIHEGTTPLLAKCLSSLITDKILRHACNVKGYFYIETRRAVNALVYMDQVFEIYQNFCHPRAKPPKDLSLKMREFLFLLKDLRLINKDLTAQHVVNVLASDDPAAADGEGCYNLELEMTFLEFFEALIGCAEIFATEAVIKDPSTPRASTEATQEGCAYSTPGSPLNLTSMMILDENIDQQVTRQGSATLTPFEVTRVSSSVKNGRIDSSKGLEGRMSVSSINVAPSEQNMNKNDPTSQRTSARADNLEPLHKSGSQISTHTGTEENQPLLQCLIDSLGEQREMGEFEEGMEAVTQRDVEEELDEDTRRFNFWTHQIHVFFVHKFFPAAGHVIAIKRLAASRKLEENLNRVSIAAGLADSKSDVTNTALPTAV